jgi:hypothetical protein
MWGFPVFLFFQNEHDFTTHLFNHGWPSMTGSKENHSPVILPRKKTVQVWSLTTKPWDCPPQSQPTPSRTKWKVHLKISVNQVFSLYFTETFRMGIPVLLNKLHVFHTLTLVSVHIFGWSLESVAESSAGQRLSPLVIVGVCSPS